MATKDWPQRLAFLTNGLEPVQLESVKIRTRMDSGHVNSRPKYSPKQGFSGQATFTEAEWQLFSASMTGTWRIAAPGVGFCQVSVMGPNPLYPGYEPVVLQHTIGGKEDGIRIVRYWFVNHGPLPLNDGRE